MMNDRKTRTNNLSDALRLLNLRPRSKHEMREILSARGWAEEEIQQVLTYLINLDYLNDIKFMESWCYFRRYVSPRGRWFVRKELSLKGISSQDLEEHFDDFYSREEEQECLAKLVQQWLNRSHLGEDGRWEKEKLRFFRALLRKGFDSTLVSEVFKPVPD